MSRSLKIFLIGLISLCIVFSPAMIAGSIFLGQQGTEEQSDDGDVGELPGKDNAEKIWNALISKGFSEAAAAGVLGNLQRESGLNPRNVEDSTGIPDTDEIPVSIHNNHGYGLAQWTTGERQDGLESYARKLGVKPGSLKAQIGYMLKEAPDQFSMSKGAGLVDVTYEQFKKIDDPARACNLWHGGFERAGVVAMSDRLAFTKQWYDKFHGKKAAAAGAASGDGAEGEPASADKDGDSGTVEAPADGDGFEPSESEDPAWGLFGCAAHIGSDGSVNLGGGDGGYDGTAAPGDAEAAIKAGKTKLGLPYVYGGTTTGPGGTDCSGLVKFAFNKAGYGIPAGVREADQIMKWENAEKIPASKAKRGDVVGWRAYDVHAGQDYGHVAIYLGNGRILEAVPKQGIHETTIYNTGVVDYVRLHPAKGSPAWKKQQAAEKEKGSDGKSGSGKKKSKD